MLNAIITWSLAHRWAVIAATLLGAVLGTIGVLKLPVDAFPDTTPVQVQVNTMAPGLAPAEVEQQITSRVEQALGGLPELRELRSLSKFGLSQVTLVFSEGIDIYFARQAVNERLAAVDLPEGFDAPRMGPIATGLGEVFHYIVSSQTHSPAELRAIQDWIIRPELQKVAGAAEVNTWGGLERQYQVVVDPARLLKHELTLGALFEALRRNNASVSGGVITRAGESLLVQAIARVATLDEIGNIVVESQRGVPIRVRDLGDIVEGHEIRHGAVTYAGRGEAVLGLGFMRMGENSREVARGFREALAGVAASLPPDVQVTPVYDRTELVDHVLHTVRTNLLEGALLVIAVLFAFLGNVRAGLIVALAIPLSMLFAGNMMLRAGIAGSLMSLGAIDFGLIVDSSVIMVENSVRRLADDPNRPRLEVVRDAALEVRRPTLFGELIIMIVYLPILTLEGMEGKLFAPMALTVIFALAGSLVLSLTLMPVLASLALRPHRAHAEPRLVRAIKRLYAPVLHAVLRRRFWVGTAAVAALAFGGAIALNLGAEFIPRLSEEAVVVNTVRLAGVSIDESVRYGTLIEHLLLEKFPDEIRHIWSRTGTAEVATDPMGIELTDVFMTLHPRQRWKRARTQEELVAAMERELAGMPAMRTIFTQPIEMRVNEMVAGIRSDVGVKVFGDRFDQLEALAGKIHAVMAAVPGNADVVTEQVTGQPVLEIHLRQDQLARYGIPAAEVLDFVAVIGPVQVGEIRQGLARIPLAVRLAEPYRSDPQRVANMLLPTASGQRLALSSLADIRLVDAPSTINREWGRRRIVVQGNVRGRDVASFVAELKQRIAGEVEFPPGYGVRYGGQFEHLQRAARRLSIVVPLTLALIFTLLYLTYRRWADCVRIFLTLPLAAVGGLAALWLRDMPFSISAGVGFVAMSGVSVLGDMVFVSHLRGLLASGVPLKEAIERTALVRLRPVLMTGLVAAFGFVPMAASTGVGAEVQRPLATVVIGSVITSTMLTLLVLPVMYSLFAPRPAAPRQREPAERLTAAAAGP